MAIRLGDVLVSRGVLTRGQCESIAEAQTLRGRPFGVLAEEMFGVEPGAVEGAWAEQFAQIAQRVDTRAIEPAYDCLRLIERRQAWQFGVLPLGFDGRLLRLATTADGLLRAMRFTNWRLTPESDFVLTKPEWLEESLSRYYAMPGAKLRTA